jgi:MSHA biogenesis protein MshQ
MKRIASILLIVLAVAATRADDNIVGILSSGTWTRTTDGNNKFLSWSAGGSTPAEDTGYSDDNTNNLVLRYWFDADATNSIGQIHDSSGLSNVASIAGATWTVAGTNTDATLLHYGRTKHSYTFDGSDDHLVTLTDSATLDPPTNISIALWIYPTAFAAANGRKGLVSKYSAAASQREYTLHMGVNLGATTGLYFTVSSSLNPFAGKVVGPAYGPSSNTWLHVVATHAKDSVCIYTNGALALQDTDAAISDSIANSTEKLYVGYENEADATRRFAGMISDVRVYTNVLTSTQVSNLWYGTRLPSQSNENGF